MGALLPSELLHGVPCVAVRGVVEEDGEVIEHNLNH
jgi:hypothetical protein